MPWLSDGGVAAFMAALVCLATGTAVAGDGLGWLHGFQDLQYDPAKNGGGSYPGPLTGHQTTTDPASWALYGISDGGTCGTGRIGEPICYGMVFKLSPPASGGSSWTFARAFVFDYAGDKPLGALTFDGGGAAYGVKPGRPGDNYGTPTAFGSLFRLTPPTGGQYFWNKTVIRNFGGGDDGCFPNPRLTLGGADALYGTSQPSVPDNTQSVFYYPTCAPTIFRLTPPAAGRTGWSSTVLYRTPATSGFTPSGWLLPDASGAVLGTATLRQGNDATYVLYELTPPATDGLWTYRLLATLPKPRTIDLDLAPDAQGNLFGVFADGASTTAVAVYRLSPPAGGGGPWSVTKLTSFGGSYFAGGYVERVDASGAVTGWLDRYTTNFARQGLAFRVTPPAAGQSAWQASIARRLDLNHRAPDRRAPRDPSGNIYSSNPTGTTVATQGGLIWRLPP